MARYVPDRGDLVWLEFGSAGQHEQRGRRPALVVSPRSYNGKVGLALACPVTGQVKEYPFEVALPEGLEVSGVVLADQVRSVDWRARGARRIAQAPGAIVAEVAAKILALVGGGR